MTRIKTKLEEVLLEGLQGRRRKAKDAWRAYSLCCGRRRQGCKLGLCHTKEISSYFFPVANARNKKPVNSYSFPQNALWKKWEFFMFLAVPQFFLKWKTNCKWKNSFPSSTSPTIMIQLTIPPCEWSGQAFSHAKDLCPSPCFFKPKVSTWMLRYRWPSNPCGRIGCLWNKQ